MPESPTTTEEQARHWDAAYATRGVDSVSWYQPEARISLELLDLLAVGRDAAVLDVGGGASVLAERLIARGFTDVSVVDVSATALAAARHRAGADDTLQLLQADLRTWRPERRFDVWHDRALFHFLVDPADREGYLGALRAALRRGGAVIVGTFAADGPDHCSGLPTARYSPAQLAASLGPGFELVGTRREEHATPAGTIQPFTWVAGRIRG